MLSSIDVGTLSAETPVYLWLLVLPAGLLALWVWQLWRRRDDARRLAKGRVLPVRERFGLAGDLGFWLCVIVATALCLVALAGPRARVAAVERAASDIVVLLDGSASMYVRDVVPDRWQRSVRFLRAFAEGLAWRGDRVALALFAHTAAPQVRLTRDPNALFFFLDHLGDTSPFALEDNPTWDTNIEEGVRWGLRLIDRDDALFGRGRNPRAFVVITDGQAWSGAVRIALAETRARGIPVYVVGVGTTTGGLIPQPATAGREAPSPIRSVLDRGSLVQVAVAGGGEYFEIGREPDRDIASRLIDRLQRRAADRERVETFEPLYWRVLFAAGVVLCLGTMLLRTRSELAWQAAAATGVLLLLGSLV